MNIWYIIIPIILILTVAGTYSLFYVPIGQCPISCDDSNPCTLDWCNSTSEYNCCNTKLSGEQIGCSGNTGLCGYNFCTEGICTTLNRTDCCGNGMCESNENCTSCFRDCGSCSQIIMKNEYQQGETINASVSFSRKIYVGYDEWDLFKYEDGEWKNFYYSSAELNCEDNATLCGMMPPLLEMPYPGCREVNTTQIRTFTWDQRVEKTKKIQCSQLSTHELVNWTCSYNELTEPGRYKLRFKYTTDCPVENWWGENTTIRYLEKEFSINSSICLGKPDFSYFCLDQLKYETNIYVNNETDAKIAFDSYVDYLEANGNSGYWYFTKAEYVGCYKNLRYWVVTYGGTGGNQQIHVNELGQIKQLAWCV